MNGYINLCDNYYDVMHPSLCFPLHLLWIKVGLLTQKCHSTMGHLTASHYGAFGSSFLISMSSPHCLTGVYMGL